MRSWQERRRAGDDQPPRPCDVAPARERTRGAASCSVSSAWRSTPPATPRAPKRRSRRGHIGGSGHGRSQRPSGTARARIRRYQARSGGQRRGAPRRSPRRRFLPSRSSVTTAGSAAPGCSQAGCVAAVHAQEAAREEAAERALIHYRQSGFPAGSCLGQIAAALYYGPAPVSRARQPLRGAAPRGENRTDWASKRRPLSRRPAGNDWRRRRRTRPRHAVRRQPSTTSDRRERRGIATRSWPTSRSWRVTSPQRDGHSRPSAPTARRATTSDSLATRQPQPRRSCLPGWRLDEVPSIGWHRSRSMPRPTIFCAQFAWRSVWAKLLAREGSAEADAMSEEAVRSREATDALNARAAAFTARAEVLRLMDRPDDADEAVAPSPRALRAEGKRCCCRAAR